MDNELLMLRAHIADYINILQAKADENMDLYENGSCATSMREDCEAGSIGREQLQIIADLQNSLRK